MRFSEHIPRLSRRPLVVVPLALALWLAGCAVPKESRSAEQYFREVILKGKPLTYEHFKGFIFSGTRWLGPVSILATFSADSKTVSAITNEWGLWFCKQSSSDDFDHELEHLVFMKKSLGSDVDGFYGGAIYSNYHIDWTEHPKKVPDADITLITARDGSGVCMYFLKGGK